MRRLALLGVLTFTLTACGGLGTVDFGSTVGPDGGLITSGDGKAKAEIPPGALEEDTEVSLESDGDGGYVLGPEDAEFDEPVTVSIDGDEPAEPVRVGDDGTEEPLDEPTILTGPGVFTSGGLVNEPGTIRPAPAPDNVTLAPHYLTVPVGAPFTADANVTRPAGDVDADQWRQSLEQVTAAGQAGAVATGQAVVSAMKVPGMSVGLGGALGGGVGAGGLSTLFGTVRLDFVCEMPGRWAFGADVPTADGRTMHWHTGTVDCVAQEDEEQFTEVAGDPTVTEPDDAPPPAGTGEITPLDGADLIAYLAEQPGIVAMADNGVAVRITPLEAEAEVDGEGFEAKLDLWDIGRHTKEGEHALATVRAKADGEVALAVGGGATDFRLLPNDPIVGIPLWFDCLKEGEGTFGATVTVNYTGTGGGTFETVHVPGKVTCVPDPTPRRNLTIADPGVWYPGGHVGVDGTSVRLHPTVFVAAPGETVTVNVELGLPGDPGRPYRRNASVTGLVGEGDAVTTDVNRFYGDYVPSPGTAQLPIRFTCVKEGVQAIGTRVYIRAEHQTPEGRENGATSPVYDAQMLLGTGVCTKDVAGGVPPQDWMNRILGGGTAQEANLPGTLQGPCQGRAAIDGYGTIDPRASGGVYKVPRKGSAKWFGAIAAVPGEERSHNGKVVVHLPPPFPAVKVGEWADVTTEVHNNGEGSWDLNPQWTPGGVLVAVSGEHNDTAGNCRATALVRIDGGPLDSAAGPASLAFTLFALGIFGWAGLPKPS